MTPNDAEMTRKRVPLTADSALTPTKSPITEALSLGQSIWYDNVRRSLITSGQLERMVRVEGLRGVTSNPSIFAKAMDGSSDYDDSLAKIRMRSALDAKSAYEELAFADIAAAADILRPVYDQSSGKDGHVSIEVPPNLAHDSQGTVAEAIRIWGAIDRPNLMIKVPGTPEGIVALQVLLGRGINVNVTLLFSVHTYEKVARAYVAALEDRMAAGGDLAGIASVASFFISRIDSATDPQVSPNLKGKIGIASAKVAYMRFKEIFSGERWNALEKAGASPQRLLWASTSTKNPAYPELLYVESLIGANTVNTIPPATYEIFKARGKVEPTLEQGIKEAQEQLVLLSGEGISLQAITDKLLADGLGAFEESFQKLLASVESSLGEFLPSTFKIETHLPKDVEAKVAEVSAEWRETSKVEKIWLHDGQVWSGKDEGNWLGWLSIALDQRSHPHHFERIAKDVGGHKFRDAIVLGMGGSSLCPEALSLTFRAVEGFPRLGILDSTDPVQIKTLEQRLDLAKTLFFVSSKSGTTLEPNIYADYFYNLTKEVVGEDQVGQHFIAITDPGSALEERATREKWRGVYHGVPSIGGRYSALSDFGMIPGAASGYNVLEMLDRAETMAHACASCVPLSDNPGFTLGAIIGSCAVLGRDKLTISISKSIFDLSAWLSQLLAESTGKDGKGVIPVDGEPLGDPKVYGNDRLFIQIRLLADVDPAEDRKIDALIKAGHPVCRIDLNDSYDIGREFFRWEFATAVAGAIIGIDPFDQPDVEDAKILSRQLTDEYEKSGAMPALTPLLQEQGLTLYSDAENSQFLRENASAPTIEQYLATHFRRANPGDYAALLAYLPMVKDTESKLTKIRVLLRDKLKIATCVGFGPRFQHSTGQAYKGGPNTGVFLQITYDDAIDLEIPGHRFTFALVKEAQARGDLDVLAKRGRRVLRINLGPDLERGLNALSESFEGFLSHG